MKELTQSGKILLMNEWKQMLRLLSRVDQQVRQYEGKKTSEDEPSFIITDQKGQEDALKTCWKAYLWPVISKLAKKKVIDFSVERKEGKKSKFQIDWHSNQMNIDSHLNLLGGRDSKKFCSSIVNAIQADQEAVPDVSFTGGKKMKQSTHRGRLNIWEVNGISLTTCVGYNSIFVKEQTPLPFSSGIFWGIVLYVPGPTSDPEKKDNAIEIAGELTEKLPYFKDKPWSHEPWYGSGKSYYGRFVGKWKTFAELETIDNIKKVEEFVEEVTNDMVETLKVIPKINLEGKMAIQQTDYHKRAYSCIEKFRQVILYGPPGTGKTRLARRMAFRLLVEKAPKDDGEVEEKLKKERDEGRFDLVVFHPSYEYEQFIRGITVRPGKAASSHGSEEKGNTDGAGLSYEVVDGPFTRMSIRALMNSEERHVLIVDEINRGNLPKLLGELVYALEYRGSHVRLPYQRHLSEEERSIIGDKLGQEPEQTLLVPENFYLIGTMNTADRSIGLVDVAIRRRFAWYHVPPDEKVVEEYWKERCGDAAYGELLGKLMKDLNKELCGLKDDEADFGVGQSYFLPTDTITRRDGTKKIDIIKEAKREVEGKWSYSVVPLLKEYKAVGAVMDEDFLKEDLNKILEKYKNS